MFDFTPVGASLAVVGVVFLTVGYRLLPVRNRESSGINEALDIANYVIEAEVLSSSAVLDKPFSDLLSLARREAVVTSILSAKDKGLRGCPMPSSGRATSC